MAANKPRSGSFSRISPSAGSPQAPGLKSGPNGTSFISTGIADLDKILGGGFALGSLVLIMEDAEAPHHMLIMRNFMSQGLVHNQPLLYVSPSSDPKAFLGTLPNLVTSKDDKSRDHGHDQEQEKGLRIAWQYRKYFGENQQTFGSSMDTKNEYCNDFDLRKPLERQFFGGRRIDCVSVQDSSDLSSLVDRCAAFLSESSRNNVSCGGRLVIQSFCAPQCEYSNSEWGMLSFLRSLKTMVRSSNAVAVVSFLPSLLSPSFSKRWQHLADTLLSVKAIPDDDKELATLLTGYKDMVGFLNVNKVARINTQVPVILEATTYSIKLQKRRTLALECLNQAPVDGASGSSYGNTGSCSSKSGSLDF
ncbi:hypothetical protein QQ045_027348 [Rhodiola kirilowii]